MILFRSDNNRQKVSWNSQKIWRYPTNLKSKWTWIHQLVVQAKLIVSSLKRGLKTQTNSSNHQPDMLPSILLIWMHEILTMFQTCLAKKTHLVAFQLHIKSFLPRTLSYWKIIHKITHMFHRYQSQLWDK